MPVDLASRFKRLLKEIISISSGIRDSALDYADGQNFDVSERLCRQLETIRISADTILRAFARATLTNYTLDDRMTDWLFSAEPYSCLSKLKEMNDVLRPVDDTEDSAPSLMAAGDRLVATIALFDTHKSLFHFLLTPDVWNSERLGHLHSEATPANVYVSGQLTTFTSFLNEDNSAAIGRESGPQLAQEKERDLKKELLHQKLGEVSRWLAPMECIQRHKDVLRLRQEGTCKWFPNTDVYERWRAPGNHFLWLHGKGGCGKSVLIASTIEHLKTSLEEEEVVAFFYCDFQNKRSTSSTELMRSVLSQLLRHIRDRGVDPGDFPDKILQQKSEGALSLDDLGKLCGLVSDAASFFRYEPMVVIDALDECADIKTLLPVLVTLSQSFVRLLVTSRPDQTIMNHFAGLQSLSFEDVTEEIGADIALHVRRELDSHSRLRSAISEMKNEIDGKLIRKADGRFRWVQCQLDTLKRCTTKEELREALDSLPNELGATYERILGEIDERKSEGELARRVLALLVAALEPLQVAQIVDGLSMDFQERKHNHETQQWLETKLLASLRSLVSYDEETDVLALSHYSVKEYLTSYSALPMYQIAFHQAHAETVQMCMGYISVYLKQEFSNFNLESFPMVFYVLSSGFSHLAYVDSESPVALEALRSLGSDVRHHPSHWDRLCELREEILEWPFVSWPSSKHDFVLYILIAYSPPGLLRTFLSSSCPLQPRIRTNPLVYAADLRKTEHAMVLLTHGADVDARGLVIDDSYRPSPLEVAIDLGDDVLVGELLKRGCMMTLEVLSTAVCMPWCSTRVLAKLMQTDEFAEWALEIGEDKLYRSVFNSARPNSGDRIKADEDHVVLARRLRQLGLDLSAAFGQELVERALLAAHIAMLEFLLPPDEPPPAEFLIAASTGDTPETIPVIRLLLRKGVDVHAVSDQRRDTALHLAVVCPWEPRRLELTKLLIDAGSKFDALNSDGESPLIIAMRQGYSSVVELLLSSNLPLPSLVLHIALEQYLLHSGANRYAITRSTGSRYITHRAIIRQDERKRNDDEWQESACLDLVQCFLKASYGPTTRNSLGAAVLEIAMQHNFASVVKLLISHDVPLPPDALLIAVGHPSNIEIVGCLIQGGANVHSTTRRGDTILHVMLKQNYYHEGICYETVKKLVNAGCDTLACNSSGATALDMAMQRKFTSVVKLLISLGVPLPPNTLLIAVQRCFNIKMVEYLIQKGANVHSVTSNGDTVLHLTIRQYHSEKECSKVVKTLLNAGCDPAACNSSGETALEIALQCDFTSVVELLLPSNVPLPSDILMIAVQQRSTLIPSPFLFDLTATCTTTAIEYLIHRGADVHSITSDGDTLLHLAIRQYHSEKECSKVVKTLLNAGCDPAACNSSGETALEIALQRDFTSMVELLLPSNVPLPSDILMIAVQQRSTLIPVGLSCDLSPPSLLFSDLTATCTTTAIEYLIHRGADVHSITSDGDTLFHLTIRQYHSEEECSKVVKILLNAGCDPAACNSSGETALEIVLQRGFTSVVELLLPSDVPLPSDILLIAVQQGSTPKMLEYLIWRGASVHSITTSGDTALHLAVSSPYCDTEISRLVKRLVNAGCDPTARNSSGKTALEIAIGHNLTSVVEVLKSPSNVLLSPGVLPSAAWPDIQPSQETTLIHEGTDVQSTTSDFLGYHDFRSSHPGAALAYAALEPQDNLGEVSEKIEAVYRERSTSNFRRASGFMPVAKRPRLDESAPMPGYNDGRSLRWYGL